MINKKDLTFIVQGPNLKDTPRCIASIKKYYPESEIILSTWQSESLPSYTDVTVVSNKDPEKNYLMFKKTYNGKLFEEKLNNLHRQLITTRSALNRVKTPFCVKMRTDFEVCSDRLINQILKYRKYNKENQYRYLSERVIIAGAEEYFPFFFFDFFYAGLTEDVKRLFYIPLPDEKYFKYFDTNIPKNVTTYSQLPSYYRWIPEQYIIIESILKAGVLKPELFSSLDWTYVSDDLREISIQILINNFCIHSFFDAGIVPMKKSLQWLIDESKTRTHFKFQDWKNAYDSL